MKKKVLTIVTAFGVLFGGAGAYTILAGSAGYDSYKEAMKKTHTVKNATANMSMSIKDNGKLLLETNTNMKYDSKQNLARAAVNVQTIDQQLTINGFLEDGKPIIQNGDSETVFAPNGKHPKMNREDGEKFHDPEMMKLGELVIDAVTQPVQGDFEMDGNTITVDMNKEDLPNLIHTIGKHVIKMGFKAHSEIELSTADYPFLDENFVSTLPKLEKDISIERAYVKATLSDEGYITKQEAIFKLKGKDEKGTMHEIDMKVNLSLTNVNKTKVETINLENKNVKAFEMKKVH